MTSSEFAKIVLALKSVYNAPNFLADDKTIEIWYQILKDLSYQECELAVMAYMSTEDKIPNPASIRKKVKFCTQKEELNEMQAWALVSKALRDSTYHAEERFNELPLVVQKAVGSPTNLKSWGQDTQYNENVAQSQFINVYRTIIKRESEISTLPQNVRECITQYADNSKLITEKG